MKKIRYTKERVPIELRQAVEAVPQNQTMEKAPLSRCILGDAGKGPSGFHIRHPGLI